MVICLSLMFDTIKFHDNGVETVLLVFLFVGTGFKGFSCGIILLFILAISHALVGKDTHWSTPLNLKGFW